MAEESGRPGIAHSASLRQVDNYQLYKPLRNLLRSYNLQACLEDVWWYFQEVSKPTGSELVWTGRAREPLRQVLHRWEIANIAREVILNATPEGTLRLRPWAGTGMVRVVNMLRRVDNDMAGANLTSDRAYNSLSAVAQHQFPWQRPREFNALMRYYKIFAAPEVEVLLTQETGVSTKDWFFMGFFMAGRLSKNCGVPANQTYESAGVSSESTRIVFERLSQPFAQLKEETQAKARYDDSWAFTWNPLQSKPLVSLHLNHPERLHCPIDHYVLKRVTQGLYYEIVNAAGFNNPFGASFQAYFGAVLSATFSNSQYTRYEEKAYKVGRLRKDGVDWILTDNQANLFIECKAKRMSSEAKSSVDPLIIGQQVEYLAKAVVQLYKNIADALAGHTQWQPNDKPIYPLVVTLEDWYLFATSAELLNESITKRMAEESLDLSWLKSMPYTVSSCEDFEDVSPTIAEIGIGKFFETKHSGEQQRWMIQQFAKEAFAEVYLRTAHRDLFIEEWDNLLPTGVSPFNKKGH